MLFSVEIQTQKGSNERLFILSYLFEHFCVGSCFRTLAVVLFPIIYFFQSAKVDWPFLLLLLFVLFLFVCFILFVVCFVL